MTIYICQLLAIWCDMRFVECRALQDTPLLTFGKSGLGRWRTVRCVTFHVGVVALFPTANCPALSTQN